MFKHTYSPHPTLSLIYYLLCLVTPRQRLRYPTTDHGHSSSPFDQQHHPPILVHVQEELTHNSPVSDLVAVGRREGMVKPHTLLRVVGLVAVRPVDDNTLPKPRHVRCSDQQRPYPPHLALSLVDEVRWVGNWVLRMELGRYRVEIGFGVEHRMVDQGWTLMGDFEEDGPDWPEGIERLGTLVQLGGHDVAGAGPEPGKVVEVDVVGIAVVAERIQGLGIGHKRERVDRSYLDAGLASDLESVRRVRRHTVLGHLGHGRRRGTHLLVLSHRAVEVGIHVFKFGFSGQRHVHSPQSRLQLTLLVRVLFDQSIDLPLKLDTVLVHSLLSQLRHTSISRNG